MEMLRSKKGARLLAILLTISMMIPGVSVVSAEEHVGGDYGSHWAKDAIQSAMDSGIVKGYPDGSFKPNNSVTRAEFFTMLNSAFKFTAESAVAFNDIEGSEWYVPSIAKALAAGYVAGYPDGSIRPNGNITRQEVATILSRIKNLMNDEEAMAHFTDAADFPAWSKGAVGAVVNAGFMKGYPDNSFRPAGLTTRAEAVTVIQGSMAEEEETTTEPVDETAAIGGGGGSGGTGSTGGGGYTSGIPTKPNPVVKTDPVITWSDPAHITYGEPLGSVQLNATANVEGTFVYNPASGTVLNAGNNRQLKVTFTPTDTSKYNAVSKTVEIDVHKAEADFLWSGLNQTYDGTPKEATVATDPGGLGLEITYNGDFAVPTAAGIYAVVATVIDNNYMGSDSRNLFIAEADAPIWLVESSLLQTYEGEQKEAAYVTSPAGLAVSVTYDGAPDEPIDAGTYRVVASIVDENYKERSAEGDLVIEKAPSTVTLGNLVQVYDGLAKPVTVTTDPAVPVEDVTVTYNNSETAPTAIGKYAVTAVVNNKNYFGEASGELEITKIEVAVTLGDLLQTYDGTPKSATATADPSLLNLVVTYNGSQTAPSVAGIYEVKATVVDETYKGEAKGHFAILVGVAPTTSGGANGKILHLPVPEVQIEYVPSGGSDYATAGTNEITGLAEGSTYIVRHKQSPDIFTSVTVPATITKKGTVLFTFDDGWKDTRTVALPILEEVGFKATLYVCSDIVKHPAMPEYTVNKDDLEALYAAGWDLSNHTINHKDFERDMYGMGLKDSSSPSGYVEFSSRTDPYAQSELKRLYEENQKWLIDNGWTRGAYHAAYPSGLYSQALIETLKGIGVQTGRAANYDTVSGALPIPISDLYQIPVQYVETEFPTESGVGNNLKAVLAAIDKAAATKETLVLMLHRVEENKVNTYPVGYDQLVMDDLIVTEADFRAIVDRVNYQKTTNAALEVMTISEWYNTQITQTATTVTSVALSSVFENVPKNL
ncbi:MBG domain-containing protein [Anaerotalea alkaliphila]|uniref:Polysaccharide deacetylase family protein n=1 Tax=Anaerotalea alkaliphila TaxID=2662126 RepID=A0A7X5HXJ6_9FIRM|nr:MBG domain-containing protein [Anaerotalea alkaliphila]NDL68453.1 polysaccharide deacetylase family protein [Anaerotalea alkaliphila]